MSKILGVCLINLVENLASVITDIIFNIKIRQCWKVSDMINFPPLYLLVGASLDSLR